MINALLKKTRRFKRRNVQLKHGRAIPLTISVRPNRYIRWKSGMDFCLALLLLAPGLPLMAVCFVLVRLTSPGPALFRQCRVGRNGVIFCLYKIRSMSLDAEARTGPAWTQAADPRITRIGHFLRKFHLDELPQLFNVIKGEMSLVGPRPERPEFVDILSRRISSYQDRLAALPGITGLAQVNLPPDSDLDSVRRKVILDLEYIKTANLSLDLRLIICTILRIFKLPALGLFGLYRNVKLPERTTEERQPGAAEKVVTLIQIQEKVNTRHTNGACEKPSTRHYCMCKTSSPLPR